MIVDPILIVASPRSGTSLLQKVVRECRGIWSLPSEGNEIWDRFCHPRLHGWRSEELSADEVTAEAREGIPRLFDEQVHSDRLWRRLGSHRFIWASDRTRSRRRLLRRLYHGYLGLARLVRSGSRRRRLVDKTTGNSLRLGYVNEIFPAAKIIHITRDGRNVVNSLIDGWRHPARFFSYDVPEPLSIAGYPHRGWKFVLPNGWREFAGRPLEQVCAFQWIACNRAILEWGGAPEHRGRYLRLKLEELAAEPLEQLERILRFLDLPLTGHLRRLARALPVVNSPDGIVSPSKWIDQHRRPVEGVLPMIEPMMDRLGYPL